ncbi:MAG: hypothetical protein JWM10_3014 [Myxococcaceae bacterium]|nr:hypothetical protein [Myxococcaceae bacterium]
MSQEDVRSADRATFIGLESTPGTTPAGAFPNAMTRIFPSRKKFVLGGLKREVLQVDDESTRRTDAKTPVLGLQAGSKLDPLEVNLKATPTAAQLDAGSTLSSLSPRIFLLAALGAEHAGEGSTCAAGSTTTTVNVQTGDGANFAIGTWDLFQVGAELEPAKITNIVGDALTVWPALSGAPVSTNVVRQLYTYAPADAHTTTVCVQQAMVDSPNAQWTCNRCVGDIAFSLEIGKIGTMALSLQVADYTGPSAQGVGIAAAADEMGASVMIRPEVYFAATVVRGTTVKCSALGAQTANDWSPVMDAGARNCVSHYVNVGGRDAPPKGMIKTRFDAAMHTAFEARTGLKYVVINKTGSGLTASFWILEMPNVTIDEECKPSEDKGMVHQEVTFGAVQDTSCTSTGLTGTALDLAVATFRVAFG